MLSAVLLAGQARAATGVYTNNFSSTTVGPEWSVPITDVTPVGANRFLGQFTNQTVSLTLTNLPSHTNVTVAFDFYVLKTWNGNATNGGPSLWDLTVAGGTNLQFQRPHCDH
jgi:hypothetical protein